MKPKADAAVLSCGGHQEGQFPRCPSLCTGVPTAGRPWVRRSPGSSSLGTVRCNTVGFRCFLLLNVLSFFLPACLPLDFLLSRVADEAFYKQPFADLIGYVTNINHPCYSLEQLSKPFSLPLTVCAMKSQCCSGSGLQQCLPRPSL